VCSIALLPVSPAKQPFEGNIARTIDACSKGTRLARFRGLRRPQNCFSHVRPYECSPPHRKVAVDIRNTQKLFREHQRGPSAVQRSECVFGSRRVGQTNYHVREKCGRQRLGALQSSASSLAPINMGTVPHKFLVAVAFVAGIIASLSTQPSVASSRVVIHRFR
jgi:hypothetical protein